MADHPLAALRAEVDALMAQLAGARPAADRSSLRETATRLAALAHATDDTLQGIRRDLAAVARKLSVGPPAPLPDQGPTRRADHLGASTYRDRGWSLIAAGDLAGAIAALRQALRLAPDEVEAEVMLGWALMLDERLDDALVVFGRVLSREPDHQMARVNLGYICLRRQIFGEAIEHLTRVLRAGSDRKATLYANYYLGLVYLERGMFRDALPFLRQALALGPNLHEASYDLGRALWFAGEEAEARATWRAAGTNGQSAPWALRCAELLQLVDAGGEVPRSRPL